MSKIGTEEVRRLAALSNIGLSDSEVEALVLELDNILKMVGQLDAAQTDDVLPTDQVTGLVDVFRADEVRPSQVSHKELLKNAPQQQDGYFKVRRVQQ